MSRMFTVRKRERRREREREVERRRVLLIGILKQPFPDGQSEVKLF